MAKKNKKQTWPKSCSKLKKRKTPQGIKRICNLHPQNIEVMHPTEEAQQEK